MKSEGTIKNEKSREMYNIGNKTINEDKQSNNSKTTQTLNRVIEVKRVTNYVQNVFKLRHWSERTYYCYALHI